MSTDPSDDPRLPDWLWDSDADRTADDDEFARELDDLLQFSPMSFLTAVSRTILVCDDCAELFVDSVDLTASREMRAVSAAVQWLLGWVELDFLGIDLPTWLLQLDHAEITSVKCATEPPGSISHLLEVTFADGQVGTIQIRVDPSDGAIVNAFGTDDPTAHLETLVRACARDPWPPYEPMDPAEALDTLTAGLGRSRVTRTTYGPANPWPSIEPLVSWVLRCLDDQLGTDRPGRAA